MSEKSELLEKIAKLEKEIEDLKEENKEIKNNIRTLATAYVNHVKGRLTVQDLQTCYAQIVQVKKFLSVVPSGVGSGGGLEEYLADMLRNARRGQQNTESKDVIDLEEIEKLREMKKKNEEKKDDNEGKDK